MTQGGSRVTTAAEWQTTRRPEVLELFRKHVYGRAPVGRPADLSFRTGKHNLTEYDWGCFMDFAGKHLGKPAAP